MSYPSFCFIFTLLLSLKKSNPISISISLILRCSISGRDCGLSLRDTVLDVRGEEDRFALYGMY